MRVVWKLLLLLALFLLPSSASWAVAASTVVFDKIDDPIEVISPTREAFLAEKYPKVPAQLRPWIPEYPWKKMQLKAIVPWRFKLTAAEVKNFSEQAQTLAAQLQDPKVDYKMEKSFLLGDILFTLVLNGVEKEVVHAQKAYSDAIEDYPDSPHVVRAAYHVGLLLIRRGEYVDCLQWSRRYESYWSKRVVWSNWFRSLIMESYYLRGRMLRAEGFMWDVANVINKKDMTAHLALRYGDSLFWQKKFRDAVKWYDVNTNFLDSSDNGDFSKVSRLYYAESLFQVGRMKEAAVQFEKFRKIYRGNYPSMLVSYRIAQINVNNAAQPKSLYQRFESISQRSSDDDLRLVAIIQWGRLAVVNDDPKQWERAVSKIQGIWEDLRRREVRDEALYVMALLRDRTGHPMAALKILSLSLPRRRIPKTMISKIQQAMIDRAVAILVEAHVLFWEKQDYQGYLTLCNEYRFAIQLGTKRIVPLFWIARAYVEGGMLTAGARLYERMLLDFKITPTQRAHLVLQLVRVYASMNKVELMDKALALLDNTPNNPVDLQQYNLAHAVVAVFKKDYPLCVKSIDDTLKVGVSGDNLFQLALQGSLCARKGGDLDKANYFLTMAGLHEGVLLPDNKASSEMISWQTKALFEKINVLVAQKNFALAANIADRLLEQYPDLDIPLETVFAVVTSYREMGLADKAASFWDQYGEQHKGEVPSEFVDEYKKLLDMLTKLELVQR